MTQRTYRHLRRNFTLFLIDYILFGVSFRLTDPSSVIPDFVQRLTADARIVGLVGTIATLLWLAPQLFFSQIISRGTRRHPFLKPAFWVRMIIPVMAGLIAAFGKHADGSANADAVVWIFIVFYAVYWTADGMFTVVWADMLGSSVPDRLRSLLYAFAQLGIALGAFAAREILNYLLGPNGPPFPDNYAVLFLIWGVMSTLGGLMLANLKEEDHGDIITPGPTFREFIPYVGNVLRGDHQFRHFVVMRLMFDISTLAMPFYILIATEMLRQPRAEFVGNSVLTTSLGSIAASVILGWLSRRSGSRAVVRVGGLARVGMPILGLLSLWTGNAGLLLGTFALLGAANSAYAPGYFDWIISYAPTDRRPIYMGLANTISALGNIAPLLGGFILSLTGSYPALMWSALAVCLVGAVLTIGLAEPRHKRT